ncbi:hypothetical protein PIB30_092196 [Stylosanthes scabra]|uniref:Ubiquitin-like protease family profile domain-containing protein n=1 Tax=Stylosanthes scabra TaxID=79078 RepID=A0ABU6RUQ5_9FABA|nr:hypothetical protein [Stylosanthes scabra]
MKRLLSCIIVHHRHSEEGYLTPQIDKFSGQPLINVLGEHLHLGVHGFKVTRDMDLNIVDTLLFKYLFSEGHAGDESIVMMRELYLRRRQIETLILGNRIDVGVVDMVAMRNACSLQHLRNPTFWCLPSRFADDVSHGMTTEFLVENYAPFWLKPSRFLNRPIGFNIYNLGFDEITLLVTVSCFDWTQPRNVNLIFIPAEDLFRHWYCIVIDFGNKKAFLLDTWPDYKMQLERFALAKSLLVKLNEIIHGPLFAQVTTYSVPEIKDWEIEVVDGIPNCDDGECSPTWVISWLDPLGYFSSKGHSGVLQDDSIRARTAISLAGGPFNIYGRMLRDSAEHWHKELS